MAKEKMEKVVFDEEEAEVTDAAGKSKKEIIGKDGLPEYEKDETTPVTEDFSNEEEVEGEEGEEGEEEGEGEEETEGKEPEKEDKGADLGARFSGIDTLSARLTTGQISEDFTEAISMQPVQYINKEGLEKMMSITENKDQEPQLTINVDEFNALLNKVALAGAKTAIRSTPKVIASAQRETAEVRDKVTEFFKKNEDLVEYSTTVARTLAQNQSAYPEKSVEELLELTNVETRQFLNLKPQAEGVRAKKKKAPRERVRSSSIRTTGSSQDRTRVTGAGKKTSVQKEMDSALGAD